MNDKEKFAMDSRVQAVLKELEEVAAMCGFKLVATIMDATPEDEDKFTPLTSWCPEWSEEFRKGCEPCIDNARRMVEDLGKQITEIADSVRKRVQ